MAGFLVGFLWVVCCALLIRLAIVEADRRSLRDKLAATEADRDSKAKEAGGFYEAMAHERRRADANYEEGKRFKERADKAERELDEANRKLGFAGRSRIWSRAESSKSLRILAGPRGGSSGSGNYGI